MRLHMHLLGRALWGNIWKCTAEKNQTNATNVTFHPFRQAIWMHIWKYTVYSFPRLEWPKTEDPFSRPFVGQNWFRLVLLNRINTADVIGYFFFTNRALFLCPTYTHPIRHPLLPGHFQQAVYWWKCILISAPEPYEHRECCGMHVSASHTHFLLFSQVCSAPCSFLFKTAK